MLISLFSDSSGRYTVVFNGEFYNFKEHRNKLITKGIKLQTNSDTEVLLHLFIEQGISFLEHINGFFSFAIYDKQKQIIHLARDRFGIKPLLYYHNKSSFAFASEMKALVALGIKKDIDRISLVNYLQLNYITSPHSIFRNVSKLKPGHYITFSTEIIPDEILETSYYNIPYTSSSIFFY